MVKHCYVHVPFCSSICGYCDFSRFVYKSETVSKWLDVLNEEIESSSIHDTLETLYLGGGTPTALNDDEFESLLKLLWPYTNNLQEYTVEMNPNDVSEAKVELLRKYGVNRVSLGVQTTSSSLLKLINRRHSFDEVKKAIDLLNRNGINNISIDIMYSLPTQTIDDLSNTLDECLCLDITHCSIYSLIIEPNSVFGKKGYSSLDSDIEADMYDMIVNKCNENGFNQYEISNFAKNGYESKHNLGYWLYNDFIGLGYGASGKENHQRYEHTNNFNKYLEGDYGHYEVLELSREDEMFENIMMNLRLIKGININEFNQRYNSDLINDYSDAISTNINNGYLVIEDDYLKTTEIGFRLLNTVLVDFIE